MAPETVALDSNSERARVRRLAKFAILLSIFALEGLWIVGLIRLVTRAAWTMPP
jgi:hypothetical protein